MFFAPRQLPPLVVMLEDLGHPSPDVVARALGVTPRTVYAWMRAGKAPRPAALAIFWETRWGRSQLDAAAVNGQRVYMGLAQSLQREVWRLQSLLETTHSVPLDLDRHGLARRTG